MKTLRILNVDDEPGISRALRRIVQATVNKMNSDRHEDARVQATFASFTSPTDALATLKDVDVELILSDFQMDEMDGVAFYERVAEMFDGHIPTFVFVSASTSNTRLMHTIERHGLCLLEKPFQMDAVEDLIISCFSRL